MSRIYDNWERLVAAVLRREQFRQLCYSDSMDSSFSSLSSDFSSSFSRRFSFDLSGNQTSGQVPPISFANDRFDPLPVPPKNPYLFRAGKNASGAIGGRTASGASPVFVAPVKMFALSQRRKRKHHIFVTGVPNLKRSELEVACEDFSNIVIGSSSTCILYKGSLSNGIEITVTAIAMASAKLWSDSLEAQFRKKIDTLSKVNHKNFLNLFGYCMEEKPFTRMMVFEYAPNGTLYEYLHLKEAVQLDWAMRLRIVMGFAYCLEHLHRLKPAFVHRNLTSSAVYLTEDYDAKLSDFFYWDEVATAVKEPNVQSNVYSFGLILFGMITGCIPYSDNWLSEFPRVQSLIELIDPTLETYSEDQLQQIGVVINSCANPDPGQRPAMREVCAWLRKITGIGPDEAKPRPL